MVVLAIASSLLTIFLAERLHFKLSHNISLSQNFSTPSFTERGGERVLAQTPIPPKYSGKEHAITWDGILKGNRDRGKEGSTIDVNVRVANQQHGIRGQQAQKEARWDLQRKVVMASEQWDYDIWQAPEGLLGSCGFRHRW